MEHRTDLTPEPYGQPVFSIAGVCPGGSNAPWKTAYPNPDASVTRARSSSHGPCFSIAGVVPGRPETAWRTANPDPTRDVLDAFGHVITKLEAELRAAARAELAHRPGVLTLRAHRVLVGGADTTP
jgi:hypothetical protein